MQSMRMVLKYLREGFIVNTVKFNLGQVEAPYLCFYLGHEPVCPKTKKYVRQF